jgi:hypothetical protein
VSSTNYSEMTHLSTVREYTLRFGADPLLPAIGITIVVVTTIEGGATRSWVAFTLVSIAVYLLANHLYEDTEDMVEDLHDEMTDNQ